ncbi:hypothetical protein Tco_0052284 [Tanacetum coccineum]
MTCSNHGGHSQPSSICALRERLLDLNGQEPQCYRSSRVSSIELTLIMLNGCGEFTQSIPISQKDKRNLEQHIREKNEAFKQLVDEFIEEGVPAAKPRLEDTEEEILQKVRKECLGCLTLKGATSSSGFKVSKERATAETIHISETLSRTNEKMGREDSRHLLCRIGLSGSDTDSDRPRLPVIRAGPDEGPGGRPCPTQPEHMDEGFTATAYPNVQENLKLTTNEQVIPEEPASSTGTLSSLQQLGKDFSFGDQFSW